MQARGRITLRPKTPRLQQPINVPILAPSPLEGPIAPAPDDHEHAHAHALAARRVAAAGAAPWGSLQAGLAMPCLPLVTDLALILKASGQTKGCFWG